MYFSSEIPAYPRNTTLDVYVYLFFAYKPSTVDLVNAFLPENGSQQKGSIEERKKFYWYLSLTPFFMKLEKDSLKAMWINVPLLSFVKRSRHLGSLHAIPRLFYSGSMCIEQAVSFILLYYEKRGLDDLVILNEDWQIQSNQPGEINLTSLRGTIKWLNNIW